MEFLLILLAAFVCVFVLKSLFSKSKNSDIDSEKSHSPTQPQEKTYQEKVGDEGESMVSDLLATLNPRYYKVLHDVLMEREDKTTYQIDHLVISRKSIFVIETKNWSGFVHGNSHDKEWIQYCGKKKFEHQNPLHQNYGKVAEIKKLFNWSDTYAKGKIQNIVVFTKDGVDLSKLKLDGLEENRKVLKKDELVGEIDKYAEFVFSFDQTKFFHQKINKSQLPKTPENLKRHKDFANAKKAEKELA